MSIGRFAWQLEYGYGPSQIYFKKNCWAMAIQQCYYFNGVGFSGVLLSFFREFFRCHMYLFIFSVGFWFLQLTVDIFCILFKKRHKNKYIKKNIQIFWKKWIYQRKVRGSHF